MPKAYKIQTVQEFQKEYKEKYQQPSQNTNMKALSTREYAKLKGVHINTVQAMLKAGEIPNAEMFGGRYRIYVPDVKYVSPEEHQKVLNENIELKALLAGISRMSQWQEIN